MLLTFLNLRVEDFPVNYKTAGILFNISKYTHHLNVTDCCIQFDFNF